jgi:hypothetical protein
MGSDGDLKRSTLMKFLLPFFFAHVAFAQRPDPVRWTLSSEHSVVTPGAKVMARLTAQIEPGWHMYSLTTPKGPIPTTIHYSLDELARRFDRSPSWVSRRLALVELLPEGP